MATVYSWDASDMRFQTIKMVPDNYTLQANETFTKPTDGLYDPKWNGSAWVGISAEEYYKQHPVKVTPDATQTAVASMLKQVATMKASTASQTTLNTDTLKNLATMKVQLASQQKINAQLMKDIASLKTANKTTTQAQ